MNRFTALTISVTVGIALTAMTSSLRAAEGLPPHGVAACTVQACGESVSRWRFKLELLPGFRSSVLERGITRGTTPVLTAAGLAPRAQRTPTSARRLTLGSEGGRPVDARDNLLRLRF